MTTDELPPRRYITTDSRGRVSLGEWIPPGTLLALDYDPVTQSVHLQRGVFRTASEDKMFEMKPAAAKALDRADSGVGLARPARRRSGPGHEAPVQEDDRG